MSVCASLLYHMPFWAMALVWIFSECLCLSTNLHPPCPQETFRHPVPSVAQVLSFQYEKFSFLHFYVVIWYMVKSRMDECSARWILEILHATFSSSPINKASLHFLYIIALEQVLSLSQVMNSCFTQNTGVSSHSNNANEFPPCDAQWA
jgi:hypothetical protein